MRERRSGGGFTHGAAIGVVCDLNDPEKWGRVRVWFPWMHDDEVSFWARIRATQAGDSRGNFIRPELGDEVVVMFERGSLNQPFVVGCVWNGKDAIPGPGNDDGKNDHKWLQTRSGHQLVFNDNAGGGWIEVHDGTQRLHTRIDVPEEWVTVRADTGFIHVRAPKGTIRLECEDLNVHTTERCDVQVANTHSESVGGSRTVTVVEQDVDTRAVERFSLSTPQMTTTAKKLVSTTGQTAVRVGEATVSVTPKLDMVLEGEVRRTIVDAAYTVGQFRTTHDGQPSGPLRWEGKTLEVSAGGSVRVASGKTLTVVGGSLTAEGGSVSYGKDEKGGQGLGEASTVSFEGGMVSLNGGAGPSFPVSKMGDTLMGSCNHTTGPAPPIPAGPIPLFPYTVMNPIAKDVVSSVKVNGMAAAPAGATAVGAHIPPMPPPPWLPKPKNYRSSLKGAFNATFKGPLSAAVSAAKSATKAVEGGESSKSVVTVEGEEKPGGERWHLRLPPLFGSVGGFLGKLSGTPPFPAAVGQLNIGCQGVQATDRPLGVATLMHAHSCSDIAPPPNATIMGGGTVVAGISASAMGEAAKWAAKYEGDAYAGGAALGHRAQRQVNAVKPGTDIVLANETNALLPFPGFVEATAVGHPVDVGSGALFDRVVDFDWPGAVEWGWARAYNSLAAGPAHGGRLGIGWRLGVEEVLTRHVPADGSGPPFRVLHTVDMRAVRLPAVEVGEGVALPGERLWVERLAKDEWALSGADGGVRRFVDDGSAVARLAMVEDGRGGAIGVRWVDGWPTLRDGGGVEVVVEGVEGGVVVALVTGEGRRPLVRYGFDARGRLGAVERGEATAEYRYDVADRMVEEVAAGGYRWAFRYDDAGRVAATWGDDGRFTAFLDYEPAAGVTRVRDGLGGRWLYRWDEAHRVIGVTAPDGGVTAIERDAHGRVVERVEPGGRVTTSTWDGRGRLVERVEADGARWRWAYDRWGVCEVLDPCGATTRVGRDEAGRVTRVRRVDGRELLRRLDAVGRVVAEDDGRRAWVAEYDERGRLVRLGTPGGARPDGSPGEALRLSLDAAGRPVRIGGAGRADVTLSYDAAGRLVERSGAAGVERWVHRADGALTAYVDVDGGRWERRWDRLGREVGWRAPSGEAVESERGVDDAYRWHGTNDGARWRYRRDGAGRLVEHAADDGGRDWLRWDAAGRLVAVDDRQGRRFEVDPDPVGRPSAVRLRDGSGWMIGRDGRGRPRAATTMLVGRAPLEVSLGRDAAGRLLEESGPWRGVQARYGVWGLTALTVDGVGLRIRRDGAGQLAQVEAPDGLHDFEGPTSERVHRLPSGYVRIQSDDAWVLRAPGGDTVARYAARRDRRGRLVEHALVERGRLRWQRRFDRDAAGRLHGDYDAGGNRLGGRRAFARGQRLVSDAFGEVAYDGRGRVVGFVDAGGACGLEWDAVDRLRRADASDGVGVEWVYDAFGRPIEQCVRPTGAPARVLRSSWWGDVLVAVDALSEVGERRAVHLPLAADDVGPWASVFEGRVWVWLRDARGAVIGAVSEAGVWWAPATDGWGASLDSVADPAPGWGPRPTLAGMWLDPVSGLMLNRFRWYRSAWGRYLSPDPLGATGGRLRYAYAEHDPASRWDPLGLSCADPEAAGAAGAASALGAAASAAPSLGALGPTETPLMPGSALVAPSMELPYSLPAPPTIRLPAGVKRAVELAIDVAEGLGAPAGLSEAFETISKLAGW